MSELTVLLDRARNAERRGSGAEHVLLDTDLSEEIAGRERDVPRVHEALYVLAPVDVRLARIIAMRYVGGLIEPRDRRGLRRNRLHRPAGLGEGPAAAGSGVGTGP